MKFLRFVKRHFLKLSGGLILLFICLLLLSFNMMKKNPDKLMANLAAEGVEVKEQAVDFKGEAIHSVSVGDTNLPLVLFIHGSPGDWTAWEGFFTHEQLSGSYCMIAYDRPGFGETEVPATASLSRQVEAAMAVMDYYGREKKFIVVGHSYGGAVVAGLLARVPERIKKAVLAAPAVAPDYQEPRWYNKLAAKKAVNWMIGKDMRSSNIEMVPLAEELRAIATELSKSSHIPQVFIHGKKDILVPFETVDYWKEVMPHGVTYILKDDMNHFIPWSHPQFIVDGITTL